MEVSEVPGVADALEETYANRFSPRDVEAKEVVWRPICRHLQRYVPDDSRVIDIACDQGMFIRNITAGEKWATDIRDVSSCLTEDIRFVRSDGTLLSSVVPAGHFDVAFMSNYLEHLPSADSVLLQLREARTLLREGGRVMILQPNIRFTGGSYWDFLDHKTPLTDKSLVEAAELAGFRTEKVIPRFLPYSTKSRLPQAGWMVRGYLACRPAWWILGKQTLYIGRRS